MVSHPGGILLLENLHRNIEKLFEFELESTQIKEGRTLFKFDQKIQVAPIRVFAPDHGAKNAHIPGMMALYDGEHLVSVKKKCL
jgi:hypothetical protein